MQLTGSVCEHPVPYSEYLLTTPSLLLYLQVCPHVVDGSPADCVRLPHFKPPLWKSLTLTVALKLSSAPSSSQSSPASSPSLVPLLPISVPRQTRRPSPTPPECGGVSRRAKGSKPNGGLAPALVLVLHVSGCEQSSETTQVAQHRCRGVEGGSCCYWCGLWWEAWFS
jgi:hypothetical protein